MRLIANADGHRERAVVGDESASPAGQVTFALDDSKAAGTFDCGVAPTKP